MKSLKHLLIYTDGGARGNPGPAACGVVIKNVDKTIVHQAFKTLGTTTNNEAEYQGVLMAIKIVLEQFPETSNITFHLDSLLVVKQLTGEFKIKNARLKELFNEAQSLVRQAKATVTYVHIPRELNYEADLLVNQALDNAGF